MCFKGSNSYGHSWAVHKVSWYQAGTTMLRSIASWSRVPPSCHWPRTTSRQPSCARLSGIVRVERDRLPLHALGLVVLAARKAQGRQGLQAADALGGQLDSMLSRRETGIQLAGSRRRIDQLEPGGVHVGEGEHRPGAGVAGIAPHCFLETGAHSRVSLQIEGTPEGERPLHAIVGEHGLRSGLRQLAGGSEVHHAIDLSEAARDSCCYVVLDIEDVWPRSAPDRSFGSTALEPTRDRSALR